MLLFCVSVISFVLLLLFGLFADALLAIATLRRYSAYVQSLLLWCIPRHATTNSKKRKYISFFAVPFNLFFYYCAWNNFFCAVCIPFSTISRLVF